MSVAVPYFRSDEMNSNILYIILMVLLIVLVVFAIASFV